MSDANDPALVISGLSKHYGAKRALNGMHLSVARGRVCALLGRNGAGKTTAIHCALGLLTPDAGTLTIHGKPAGSLAARQIASVMLQDSDLPELLTAREHLALIASYYPTARDCDAVIAECDLGAFADTHYKRLSGGQKRRVQFACALVGNPSVLFLDEPTTGLDQASRQSVWAQIRALAADGRSIILTTHYLEEADALADQICILNDGVVIADDTAVAVRERVGGSVIECRTSLSDAALRALPGVNGVTAHGQRHTLLARHAPDALRALLAADDQVGDISVSKPSLEQTFSALTRDSGERLS